MLFIRQAKVTATSLTAFPAETAQEEAEARDMGVFGTIEYDEDFGDEHDRVETREQTLFEELLLQGRPCDGAIRRRQWLKLRRAARAAIRRFRHPVRTLSQRAIDRHISSCQVSTGK